MNIVGKIVTLRAPELTDIEKLHAWSNDPGIWHLLGGWHFPFSKRSTEEWVRTRKDNNQTDHVFCIDAPDVGLIGTANLVNIDWKNKNAFHGIMIGDSQSRGKGYALDSVMTLMKYVFDELGLERLDSAIIDSNERSLQFYTKACGWEIEGRQKNWFFRKGKFFDRILVGVTKQAYFNHVKNTAYWNKKP